MTIRRTIPLLALAATMMAAATAHAGPVGNQYVPQVPKAGNKHHDSGSSGSSSSSYAPISTTPSSEPTQATPKQKPAKSKHQAAAKATKLAPATSTSAGGVDSGGGPWIPIAILVVVVGASTAVGLTLRRRAA
jgi:hypothetical protein